MSYFINWRDPSAGVPARASRRALGEVVPLLRPRRRHRGGGGVVGGARACSSRCASAAATTVDGGVFSNQPLHAVVADGADAMLRGAGVAQLGGPARRARASTWSSSAVRLHRARELARPPDRAAQRCPQGWSRERRSARACAWSSPDGAAGRDVRFRSGGDARA